MDLKERDELINKGCGLILANLLTEPGYSPYCGKERGCPGLWPRTYFNGKQFVCRSCGWVSQFTPEFIEAYKAKWNK